MCKKRTFYRKFTEETEAVAFADKTGGIMKTTDDGYVIEFEATYSISKALYNVKSDKYRVYLRLRPGTGNPLTYTVASEYSKKAYEIARDKVKDGWL